MPRLNIVFITSRAPPVCLTSLKYPDLEALQASLLASAAKLVMAFWLNIAYYYYQKQ